MAGENAAGISRVVRGGSAPANSAGAARGAEYTAILHFHGIGRQRRHQEISHLVDSLDQLSENDDVSIGKLRGHVSLEEPPRVPDMESDVPYVFIRFLPNAQSGLKPQSLRLYEAYWSPYAAGNVSPLWTILWLLSHAFSPLRRIFRPWRSQQRVKRTTLFRSWPDWSDRWSIRTLRELSNLYHLYENWEARRRFPSGSFGAFRSFVRWRRSDKPLAFLQELDSLARAWFRSFIRGALLTFVFAMSVALACGILGTYVAVVVAAWYHYAIVPTEALGQSLSEFKYALFASSAFVLGIAAYIWNFVRSSLADVVFWATYAEKEEGFRKRRDILNASIRLIRHILADGKCKRLVITGHSLGSAIAYDALREIGRFNEARRGIYEQERIATEKITSLVTLGSPIDRIFYFVEAHDSQYHRYNRTHEKLTGDISRVPFWAQNQSLLLWINFFDKADPVSSALYSPYGPKLYGGKLINVEIASFRAPRPIAAHLSYIEHPGVLRTIIELAVTGNPPKQLATALQLPFPRIRLPSVGKVKWQRFATVLGLAIPWLFWTTLLSIFIEPRMIWDISYAALLGSMLAFVAASAILWLWDGWSPLVRDAEKDWLWRESLGPDKPPEQNAGPLQ